MNSWQHVLFRLFLHTLWHTVNLLKFHVKINAVTNHNEDLNTNSPSQITMRLNIAISLGTVPWPPYTSTFIKWTLPYWEWQTHPKKLKVAMLLNWVIGTMPWVTVLCWLMVKSSFSNQPHSTKTHQNYMFFSLLSPLGPSFTLESFPNRRIHLNS